MIQHMQFLQSTFANDNTRKIKTHVNFLVKKKSCKQTQAEGQTFLHTLAFLFAIFPSEVSVNR